MKFFLGVAAFSLMVLPSSAGAEELARLQMFVPQAGNWTSQYPNQIESLQGDHDFLVSPGFPNAVDVGGFAPLAPEGYAVVEIDIHTTAEGMAMLERDPRVRAAWFAQPFPAEGPYTEEHLFRLVHLGDSAAQEVEGFVGFGVGPDCGLEEQHVHIVEHAPSVWIYYDAMADAQDVERELLERVPELRRVNRVLKIQGQRPFQELANGDLFGCFLPEGCR